MTSFTDVMSSGSTICVDPLDTRYRRSFSSFIERYYCLLYDQRPRVTVYSYRRANNILNKSLSAAFRFNSAQFVSIVSHTLHFCLSLLLNSDSIFIQ